MKEKDLLVSIRRAGQTTKSLQGDKPWSNLLETLEVSHKDQVWVGDITYVRLKGRFIYLCLLMDVFTRVIRAWEISQHLNPSLTLKPLKEAFCHSVPEIHHSDQGVQYLSKTYRISSFGMQRNLLSTNFIFDNDFLFFLLRHFHPHLIP